MPDQPKGAERFHFKNADSFSSMSLSAEANTRINKAYAAGVQEGRKQALAEVDEWDRGHLKTDKEPDQ